MTLRDGQPFRRVQDFANAHKHTHPPHLHHLSAYSLHSISSAHYAPLHVVSSQREFLVISRIYPLFIFFTRDKSSVRQRPTALPAHLTRPNYTPLQLDKGQRDTLTSELFPLANLPKTLQLLNFQKLALTFSPRRQPLHPLYTGFTPTTSTDYHEGEEELTHRD